MATTPTSPDVVVSPLSPASPTSPNSPSSPTSPSSPAAPAPAPTGRPKKVSLAHKLWTGQVSYDFVGNRRVWYSLSAFLLVLCVVGLFVRDLQLGIEFSGGSRFQVDVAVTETTVGDFRQAAESSGVTDLNPTVTTIGANRVTVETRALDAGEQVAVRQALADQAKVAEETVAYDQIGASWGKDVTQKAATALVVFLVLVSLLIGLYFRYAKMALSAIICLLHDLIVTVGVYAWVGFSVTPATLTGVLTILGYSLYDTVVVFDKVRENWAAIEGSKLTYAEAANLSDNQVIVRSVNTTIIGVLPVAAILIAGSVVLGSGPLEDIGLALFVGMIVGAYSSVFLATPLLAQMKDMEPAVKEHTERVLRRRAKAKRFQPRAGEDGALAGVGAAVDVLVVDSGETREPGQSGDVTAGLSAASPTDSRAVGGRPPTTRTQPRRQPRSQRKK